MVRPIVPLLFMLPLFFTACGTAAVDEQAVHKEPERRIIDRSDHWEAEQQAIDLDLAIIDRKESRLSRWLADVVDDTVKRACLIADMRLINAILGRCQQRSDALFQKALEIGAEGGGAEMLMRTMYLRWRVEARNAAVHTLKETLRSNGIGQELLEQVLDGKALEAELDRELWEWRREPAHRYKPTSLPAKLAHAICPIPGKRSQFLL